MVQPQGVGAIYTAAEVHVKGIELRHKDSPFVGDVSFVGEVVLGIAEGVGYTGGSPAKRFPQECSLPPIHLCQLMAARTRCVSQTIIEAQVKSLDDSTGVEKRQAGLPLVERGPTVGERRMYQTPSACAERQQGLSGNVAQTR